MLDKLSGSLRLGEDALNVLHNLTGTMSMLMPADALQRRMTAELFSLNDISALVSLSNGGFSIMNISSYPSVLFIVYAAGYTLLAFAVGLLRFQRKDL